MSSPATPRNSLLAVPASQNTAPVIKFRCLYTYDLRRKAKRWQDGFLRFHTFNKRVMVYDTPGNFIGDLHWRQDAGVQDGDEMELDKGVLIEVCECMEKTETDLSTLFDKKKQPASPRAQDRSTQSSTPVRSTIASQPSGARRSLNDLLGIKRTPIERLVSPYEERLPARREQAEDTERASKRQRVEPEARPQKSQSNRQPAVIDLCESTPAAKPAVKTHSQPRKEPVVKTSSSPAQPTPQSTHVKPDPPSSRLSSNPTSEKPANMLRLSADKPRKKLMYRALLPTQGSTKPSEPPQRPEKTSRPISGGTSQKTEPATPDHSLATADFAPSDSTQFALDEIALPSSIKPEPISQSKPVISVRPANSAKDAYIPVDIKPRQSAPLPTINARPAPRTASTRPLQKSLSDPTALTTASGVQSRRLPARSALATLVEDNTHDQGPWSSEAQDLFDFWPPGRPKPA